MKLLCGASWFKFTWPYGGPTRGLFIPAFEYSAKEALVCSHDSNVIPTTLYGESFMLTGLVNMVNLKVIPAKSYEEMKKRGGVKIRFGFHESPIGKCLIGVQGKRVCHISFVVGSEEENLNALKRQWPGSDLTKEEKSTGKMVEEIFGSDGSRFEVMSKGSSFEARVWEALLKIPKGTTVSYEDVAVMIGHKKAVRAVANAVGKNPVSYLVPCHRVIRKDGSLHKYRWGADVKKKLLALENCYF